METESVARVPATWPEPYVTENLVVDGLYVEEEAVLKESPLVQLVLFELPPREGFWVAPCCWQLFAVTHRSL